MQQSTHSRTNNVHSRTRTGSSTSVCDATKADLRLRKDRSSDFERLFLDRDPRFAEPGAPAVVQELRHVFA